MSLSLCIVVTMQKFSPLCPPPVTGTASLNSVFDSEANLNQSFFFDTKIQPTFEVNTLEDVEVVRLSSWLEGGG